jgi:outer membrane protein assembly complex protein YaeT
MDLSNPRETLNIHTHITQLKFVSGQHQVKNEGPIVLFYNSNGIQIENLELTGTGMLIRINGSLPRQQSSGAELYTEAVLDLSLVTHFLPDLEAGGVLRIESHVKGSLLEPDVMVVVDLADAKVRLKKPSLMFEDVQLHLDIKENEVHIELFSFQADGGKYELKGVVPFEAVPSRLLAGFQVSGSRAAELQFQFKNFKLSLLSSVFAQKALDKVNGKIDGEIRIKGKSLRLSQVSARATLETLDLDILDIPLSQDDPTEIVLDNGKVLIQDFALKGAESRLQMSGSVDLYGRKSINMRIDGDVDLKVLKVFMDNAFFAGKCAFQIQATETMKNPSINGFMEVQKAGFQMAYPGVFLSQVNGRIELDQSKLKIERLQGDLNGGVLAVDGEMDFKPWALTTAGVNIRIENALFNFPKDLNSQISSELKLESDGSKHLLKGTVNILTARYTESFSLESAIYRYFQRGTAIETFKEPNVILKDLHFDIATRTANPFLIDNNISKSEMTADLKLTGNFYNPALGGRIDFLEGGKVFFGKNTFLIEKGTVDFISTNRIVPDINLKARTRVSEYDVQLILTGTPDRLSAQLLSDPYLTEPNIVSLLVTGRGMENASAPLLSAAGSGALSYINNTLTGKVEQVTRKSLGIESVRLDASLVSTQENPGARVTFGQHITRDFELVFSQDLKDARNRTWILNFNPVRDVNLQGVKQDNNEYNFSLRHELRFGLDKEKKQPRIDRQKKGPLVGSITFEGQLGVSENRIRKQMKSKPKKRFDFYKFQKDQDRIRDLYRKNDYLSSSLVVEKKEETGKVDFVIRVESGPKIHLVFQGGDISRKLKTEIEKSWMGSTYGPMVVENIRQKILLHFLKKRYCQVNVRTREYLSGESEKTIIFSIDKGARFKRLDVAYEGNQFITRYRISHYLKKSRLLSTIFVNPEKVTRTIESLYSQNGFLRTRVRLQDINFDKGKNTAHVLFRIDEGAQFKIKTVSIRGIRFFSEEVIINQIQIHQGDVFSPKTFNEAQGQIRELYAQKGFNNVIMQPQIRIYEEAAEIDLLFNVEENDQAVIEKVHLTGNAVTRPWVIRRELLFKEGNTVNFLTINQTRKRLYDLGVFERVNINVLPMESQNSSLAREDGAGPIRPYQLDVEVEELKPFRLRYGFLFDTDTGLGASGELVNRNVFGRAQLLGISFRADQDERDFRVFFRSHYFLSKRINTELFTFVKRSEMPAFTIDRTGFTIQQQHSIGRSDILLYNYTFERNRTFARTPEGQISTDTSVHVGTLNTAFTRDTRDNILNASRGIFFSQSVGYAAKLFGSDINFVRYFGQFNAYARLSDFIVYAVGLRVGLSKGLGQEMIPSEKFFAGGGTTIRGFGKNEIGPLDPLTGLAEGGNAVLILNQEVRFPIYKRLGGAAFLDIGNVYSAISDFDLLNVRKAAGFGLRYNTPFVLVRVDWGFKLDRKPGESLSRIFFSIGQAF